MKRTFDNFNHYVQEYLRSVENPEAFWEEKAKDFIWYKPWNKILTWDFTKPEVKWFEGAKLNITENCIDRHLTDRADQTAIIWEANDPNEPAQHISYLDLHREVCRLSNTLKNNGVEKGDRVCIYMPMVPELAYAVLACARIGAVHSVVFAGFSSSALADRINDATTKVVLTADGAYRGAKILDLKSLVNKALESCNCVETVLTLQRTKNEVYMQTGRDLWWHEETAKVDSDCSPAIMDAEDMLFILYTSGSTGKPKGMVHTCGGYMVYTAYTFQNAFQYQTDEIYWCTADIGWITGHSYIVYGPLSSGATTVMFEGIPSYPHMGRFWEVVEKHKINIFYTAPTAIRALEKAGAEFPRKHDLSSLRTIGTVGEPINEEAWHWYNTHIGGNRCPVVDTYWQTETGGFMISPISGITPTKPAHAGLPLPGVQPCIVGENGKELTGTNVEGRFCITFPWPSIARTIYGDHQRFKDTYFSNFEKKYFTGDSAKRDAEGYYRIVGRVDDIIITSGHNLGTAEIESAIDEHKNVCETAVVGYPHDVKGNAIYAYVTCYKAPEDADILRSEILSLVAQTIGPIAKPEKIQFVSGLPKTRSGKIMRRILRKVAEGDTSNLGDVSTLLNAEVVDEIIEGRFEVNEY